MPAIRISLLLGVLALTLAVAPCGATAKPGYVRLPPSFSFSLQLPRADGYRLQTSAGHSRFSLSAYRGETSATYSAPGFANRHRLEADLGRFGRVDVRFDQTSAARVKRPLGESCRGPRPIELRGTAAGTVRFRGFNGFVSLAQHRVEASILHTFAMTCPSGAGSFYGRAGSEPQADTLTAKRRAGGELIQLAASNTLIGSLTIGFVSARTSRRIDGVQISDAASASPRDAELVISHRGVHPETATLVGSGPFSGEASYQELASGKSDWSGSLRVSLPGEGTVPLSGPGFHAEICHGSRARVFGGCRSQGSGSRPQGSGSQSQSLFETRLSWSR